MKKIISLNSLFSKDLSFLLGLAISASFIEALMPAKGISLLLCFYFIFTSLSTRQVTLSLISGRIKFSFYFVSLVIVYLFSLLITPLYLLSNGFFLVQVISIYGLFLFSPKHIDQATLWRGFNSTFLPLTIFVGFCGMAKAFLIARGYFLEPLYLVYSFFDIAYPPGSSIRPDYNIFSIAILSGTFFILSKDGFALVNKYIYSLVVGVLLLCGYYSTSRRGILFMIALPFCLLMHEWFRKSLDSKKVAKMILLSATAGALLYISGIFVLTGVGHDTYKLWPNLKGAASIHGPGYGVIPGLPFPEWMEAKIKDFKTSKTELAPNDLEFPSRSFVTNERNVRWKFAWQILQENKYVMPMGFAYQEKFGCRFVKCNTKDYPHNVFLSEFLVAGILGLGLCIWIFIRHAVNLYSLKNDDMKSKLFILSFFAFPNLLISGDYLFTSGMSVAVIVLLLSVAYEQKQNQALKN